jgi:hypothetical protein
VTLYPFNEDRQQLDPYHCPAPFCGRVMDGSRGAPSERWHHPVMFAADMFRSFADVTASPAYGRRGVIMATCARPACKEWGRLRADDLRDMYPTQRDVDAARWRYCPEVPRELGGHGRRAGRGNIWDERESLDRYRQEHDLPPIDWDRAAI